MIFTGPGLPNALLEALAMEKPCIASRIYGMPEVVIDGETGYCFEAGKAVGDRGGRKG